MRNLSIKRHKSFVGCLVKTKLYIEDATASELIINSIPCRKLGEIKNGEQKTFEIGEQAARVFAIVDTLSKDYCNEYYTLEHGEDDLFLSGKHNFNPANGNAFRFDNNQSDGIAENRKKGSKKGLIVLLIAALIGLCVGVASTLPMVLGLLSDSAPQEKTFVSEGMSITLTDEFTEVEVDNYTVAYDSRDIAVLALQEAVLLADGEENYTLEEYAKLIMQNNSLDPNQLATTDGLTHFTYTATIPDTNDTYGYFTCIYEDGATFWIVQFATLEQNIDEYSQQFLEWAKSVEFAE